MIIDLPLPAMIIIVVILAAIFFILKKLVLPKSFYESQSKREELIKARLHKNLSEEEDLERERED
jgi:uncharacterized membrane protein